MNPIDRLLFQILPTIFVLCGVMLSVWLFFCSEVWTLGVWGELACHKRLFNPPPQFSRLGTWCPAFVCVYMYVCVCVCVYLLVCLVFIFWWRVCVWWFGGGRVCCVLSRLLSFIATHVFHALPHIWSSHIE